MSFDKIQVKKYDPDLPDPTRKHPGDAGIDLYSTETFTLEPGETRSVGTGVGFDIPFGWVGYLCMRSGISRDRNISTVDAPGVIDHGYTGEVHMLLVNVGQEPSTIERGERVNQIVFHRCALPKVEIADELPDYERGNSGFGSTGTK